MGSRCEQFCADGSFGLNCTKECSQYCLNSNCDPVNGQCTRCFPGYAGIFCNKSCPERHFGFHCSQPCSPKCLDFKCHPVDGSCFNCSGGYHGAYCTENSTATVVKVIARVRSPYGMIALILLGIIAGFTICALNIYGYGKLKLGKFYESDTDITQQEIYYSSTINDYLSSDTQPLSHMTKYELPYKKSSPCCVYDGEGDIGVQVPNLKSPRTPPTAPLIEGKNSKLCLDLHLYPRYYAIGKMRDTRAQIIDMVHENKIYSSSSESVHSDDPSSITSEFDEITLHYKMKYSSDNKMNLLTNTENKLHDVVIEDSETPRPKLEEVKNTCEMDIATIDDCDTSAIFLNNQEKQAFTNMRESHVQDTKNYASLSQARCPLDNVEQSDAKLMKAKTFVGFPEELIFSDTAVLPEYNSFVFKGSKVKETDQKNLLAFLESIEMSSTNNRRAAVISELDHNIKEVPSLSSEIPYMTLTTLSCENVHVKEDNPLKHDINPQSTIDTEKRSLEVRTSQKAAADESWQITSNGSTTKAIRQSEICENATTIDSNDLKCNNTVQSKKSNLIICKYEREENIPMANKIELSRFKIEDRSLQLDVPISKNKYGSSIPESGYYKALKLKKCEPTALSYRNSAEHHKLNTINDCEVRTPKTAYKTRSLDRDIPKSEIAGTTRSVVYGINTKINGKPPNNDSVVTCSLSQNRIFSNGTLVINEIPSTFTSSLQDNPSNISTQMATSQSVEKNNVSTDLINLKKSSENPVRSTTKNLDALNWIKDSSEQTVYRPRYEHPQHSEINYPNDHSVTRKMHILEGSDLSTACNSTFDITGKQIANSSGFSKLGVFDSECHENNMVKLSYNPLDSNTENRTKDQDKKNPTAKYQKNVKKSIFPKCISSIFSVTLANYKPQKFKSISQLSDVLQDNIISADHSLRDGSSCCLDAGIINCSTEPSSESLLCSEKGNNYNYLDFREHLKAPTLNLTGSQSSSSQHFLANTCAPINLVPKSPPTTIIPSSSSTSSDNVSHSELIHNYTNIHDAVNASSMREGIKLKFQTQKKDNQINMTFPPGDRFNFDTATYISSAYDTSPLKPIANPIDASGIGGNGSQSSLHHSKANHTTDTMSTVRKFSKFSNTIPTSSSWVTHQAQSYGSEQAVTRAPRTSISSSSNPCVSLGLQRHLAPHMMADDSLKLVRCKTTRQISPKRHLSIIENKRNDEEI